MELEKLNKILEYQKIDMEVYKKEKELNQADELKRIQRCRKMFDEKKNALAQLFRELDEALAQIAAMDGRVDSVKASKDIDSYDPSQKEDLAELNELEREFSKFEDEIVALGKEINKLTKRINDINFDDKRINEEMQVINSDFKKFNLIMEGKKKDMLSNVHPKILELKKLIPELDEKCYAKYIELRKEKKMPAFVVYNEGSCGGCGMDISIEVKAKLVNIGDVTECPHCGRVVYKKN